MTLALHQTFASYREFQEKLTAYGSTRNFSYRCINTKLLTHAKVNGAYYDYVADGKYSADLRIFDGTWKCKPPLNVRCSAKLYVRAHTFNTLIISRLDKHTHGTDEHNDEERHQALPSPTTSQKSSSAGGIEGADRRTKMVEDIVSAVRRSLLECTSDEEFYRRTEELTKFTLSWSQPCASTSGRSVPVLLPAETPHTDETIVYKAVREEDVIGEIIFDDVLPVIPNAMPRDGKRRKSTDSTPDRPPKEAKSSDSPRLSISNDDAYPSFNMSNLSELLDNHDQHCHTLGILLAPEGHDDEMPAELDQHNHALEEHPTLNGNPEETLGELDQHNHALEEHSTVNGNAKETLGELDQHNHALEEHPTPNANAEEMLGVLDQHNRSDKEQHCATANNKILPILPESKKEPDAHPANHSKLVKFNKKSAVEKASLLLKWLNIDMEKKLESKITINNINQQDPTGFNDALYSAEAQDAIDIMKGYFTPPAFKKLKEILAEKKKRNAAHCPVCKKGVRSGVLCDGCLQWYHLKRCSGIAGANVPPGDWFCSFCS